MATRVDRGSAVGRYYDEVVDEEERRLIAYPFELPVTLRFVSRYLAPGALMLDAACGTGRYAEALLSAGYRVGASDLSDANIRATENRLANGRFGSRLHFVRQGNALDAASYAGGPWDGILLLGPCYHLPERADRVDLLKEARAHLAPGGRLYVGFVSRIAVFWWGLQRHPERILDVDGVGALLASGGPFNFADPGEGLPEGYFSDPREFDELFAEAGLSIEHVCGTEGVFGGRVSQFQQLEPRLQTAWLDFMVNNCEAPIFRWTSEHLLVVARK